MLQNGPVIDNNPGFPLYYIYFSASQTIFLLLFSDDYPVIIQRKLYGLKKSDEISKQDENC